MKKYKAIFFDWDGTAVISRKAPVDEVVVPMKKLLAEGVKLVIVSGTTIENIADGKLHECFSAEELENLYLGLGRGVYNYGFTKEGLPVLIEHKIPTLEEKILVHRVSYEIHEELLKTYGLNTDIVFSRPNYCKIDLMVDAERNDQLYLQSGEIGRVNQLLWTHGYKKGIRGLVEMAEEVGNKCGISLKATTDAKYLEVGFTLKSDNVNFFMKEVMQKAEIKEKDCCFWGDEFTWLDDGIPGSDAYMITEQTSGGDFFDVSPVKMNLPKYVNYIGGSVKSFIGFLESQGR